GSVLGGVGGAGVVVVAREVGAALDPGCRGAELGHRSRPARAGLRRLVIDVADGGGVDAEVGVRVVDAGVDHGQLDALAVEVAGVVPGLRRPDVGDALGVGDGVVADGFHVHYAGEADERGDLG